MIKRFRFLIFLIFLNLFISCVSAESIKLNVSTVSEHLILDVTPSDIFGTNNIFSGTIKYDSKIIDNVEFENIDGWFFDYRMVENNIKFLVYNVNDFASNDTVLFKVKLVLKPGYDNEKIDVLFEELKTVGNSSLISVNDVTYKYEYIKSDEKIVVEEIFRGETEVEKESISNKEDILVEDDKKEESLPENDTILAVEGETKECKKCDTKCNHLVCYILLTVSLVINVMLLILFIRKRGN